MTSSFTQRGVIDSQSVKTAESGDASGNGWETSIASSTAWTLTASIRILNLRIRLAAP
ncbi:hypothetical protein [Sphingobium xenophagum]|uniref:hypothetical protein n=1 Tax=Sphingobium xenophagum TaxID=121428 RepID=UPI00286AA462|nr:hypothetical protein [Sphingobium xenophagum]